MDPSSIGEFLGSDDPLSERACEFLLAYKEEDTQVDYKESFDPTFEKFWIDVAIDACAFANTNGGYLVFGVKDKTYEMVGISKKAYDGLLNIKEVSEKISRGVQPKLGEVRSKGKVVDDKYFVFLLIPQTIGRTYVFEKNLDFLPPGQAKNRITIVRQGAIYVRKSGSNQLLSSSDFEELLHRRIQRFKDKLMDGLARVVSAGPDQEVLVVSAEEAKPGTKAFIVTDAPDAIPVKGISFSAVPKTIQDRVAAWIAVNKADPTDYPTPAALMEVFAGRGAIHLSEDQKLWLAYFSLVRDRPAFYWLSGIDRPKVEETLKRAFNSARAVERIGIIKVSGFYGEQVYESLRKAFGASATTRGAGPFKDLFSLFKTAATTRRIEDEKSATVIATKLSKEYDVSSVYTLIKLDCALYAPFG